MKKFIIFTLLTIAALAGIKLIYILFNLGEMEWFIIAIPIAIYFFSMYGFPFVKAKKKE